MSTYRTISHLTEASIRLNYSAPSSPMWLAYDCGCRHISRLDGSSQWNLCAYHEGFEDGIDAADRHHLGLLGGSRPDAERGAR